MAKSSQKAKSAKKQSAQRRRKRRASSVAVHLEGVSASAQAGNITASDTPLPLRAETNPANWSPADQAADLREPTDGVTIAQDETEGEQSFGVEFLSSDKDPIMLHSKLMARVAVLEVALQELRAPSGLGIGHNRPPPDEFAPVTARDVAEIDRLIELLKQQPPTPVSVPPQLVVQERRVNDISTKILRLVDAFAEEAVKSAGKEVGKRLAQAPFWLSIYGALHAVTTALQQWIAVVPH